MNTITIKVDNQIKQAFDSATPETQQQLKTIINLFFQQSLSEKILTDVMEEIAVKATERGLTEEILQDILADEE